MAAKVMTKMVFVFIIQVVFILMPLFMRRRLDQNISRAQNRGAKENAEVRRLKAHYGLWKK